MPQTFYTQQEFDDAVDAANDRGFELAKLLAAAVPWSDGKRRTCKVIEGYHCDGCPCTSDDPTADDLCPYPYKEWSE